MRPKTFVYLVCLVTVALALAGAYFTLKSDSAKDRLRDTEAPARIENVDVRRATDPVFGDEDTVDVTVTYSYDVAGEKYRRTRRLSKSEAQPFVPWGNAKVCYTPTDQRSIEEGKLFPSDHRCGGE